MKQITKFIAVLAIMFFAVQNMDAKVKFGVKGGLNYTSFNSIKFNNLVDFSESIKGYTGFNAGLTLKVDLPLGFGIQPSLLYSQTGSKFTLPLDNAKETLSTLKTGALEVPIDVQWGVKLGPVKPYIMASPYFGYALMNKISIADWDKNLDDNLQKFEYGIGVGAGVDLWMVQISFKYKWKLGTVFNLKEEGLPDNFKEAFDDTKLQGFEIGLAVFF